LPRRKTAGRAWLSKGGPVSPAKTVLRSFPHRRKNSDSAIIALDPRFRGGERREMRARCKSYSAHSRESGTPGHKFRCRRMRSPLSRGRAARDESAVQKLLRSFPRKRDSRAQVQVPQNGSPLSRRAARDESAVQKLLRSFPRKRESRAQVQVPQNAVPAFAGTSGGRKKKSRRCLAGGFLWTAARVGETALAGVRFSCDGA